MISKTDLVPVTEYKMALGRVLSVYLDVDQAHAEKAMQSNMIFPDRLLGNLLNPP